MYTTKQTGGLRLWSTIFFMTFLLVSTGSHAGTTKPGAPELGIPDIDGKQVNLSQYRGKVVAVNFWATWCPPCREELPSMQHTYEQLKGKGFVILAVNIGEPWDTVTPFVTQLKLSFPVLLDQENLMMQRWKAMGLPTTYIVGRDGNIVKRITGGRDWNSPEFRALLDSALKK